MLTTNTIYLFIQEHCDYQTTGSQESDIEALKE